jgi:molybdopterin converting factor subunit 1
MSAWHRALYSGADSSVKVSVQLFAVAKQLAKRANVEIELPPQATVADVRAALLAQVPELAGMARQLRFAVDEEYVPDHASISERSRIACIPPVSGG